jgi:hypothetical protein
MRVFATELCRTARADGHLPPARAMIHRRKPRVRGLLAMAWLTCLPLLAQPAAPSGLLEGHADIGTVLHHGSTAHDTARGTYTLTGSGENMWFATDAFHFAWKRVSGDISVSADIAFPAPGGNAHRKGVLMIRQSLDANSAYADAALHGDGLTSLQYRDETGANTHEIQANISAPRRLRLEKRGDYVYLLYGAPGQTLNRAGGAVHLRLREPFYIGLGVCSHDKDAVEKVEFSNVEFSVPSPGGKPELYSTVETVAVSSTDRRVAFTAPGRIQSPNWTPDGAALIVNREGQLRRLKATGGEPEPINTGAQPRASAQHTLSPDGATILFTAELKGKPLPFTVPTAGGAPSRVPRGADGWSQAWAPDNSARIIARGSGRVVDLYAVPTTGGKIRRLTKNQGRNLGAAFSPDSHRIYFHSSRSGNLQLWTMDADGANPAQLTRDANSNWAPSPSPDGKRVAYLSSAEPLTTEPIDSPIELRVLNLADGKITTIARLQGGEGTLAHPSWSPDGRRLTFVSYQLIP